MIGTFAILSAGAYNESLGTSKAMQDAASAKGKTYSLQREIRVLKANLAKSMMICEVLWEIVRDRHGLTEDDLHKKLYEVDMRDGTLDGKNQRNAVECPNCGRKVSARHPACLYCGQVIDDSVFTIN